MSSKTGRVQGMPAKMGCYPVALVEATETAESYILIGVPAADLDAGLRVSWSGEGMVYPTFEAIDLPEKSIDPGMAARIGEISRMIVRRRDFSMSRT